MSRRRRQRRLRTPKRVAESLPRRSNGRSIHVSAIYRWINKGLWGTKLQAIQVGGQMYISDEALAEFFGELSRKKDSQIAEGTSSSSPRDRELEQRVRKALGLEDNRASGVTPENQATTPADS